MYAEFAVDPKVQMLSEANQRRFLMLLCLRCSNDDVTLHDEEIAFQLRISNDEWADTKAVFIAKKLIDENNAPSAWDKRQFVSDSSAERVSRHRAKKKQPCNVTVTPPEADTDTDTEAEEASTPESEVDTPTEGAREPEKRVLQQGAVATEPPEPPQPSRRGTVCRLLRSAGIADAAPHHLADETWDQILALRSDEEIVEFALAKLATRPGQRLGLKYLAPGLLDQPQPIAAPNARASPLPASKTDQLRARNQAAFAEAKAAILAREAANADR